MKTLEKSAVADLLRAASARYTVFAPVREPSGDVNFRSPGGDFAAVTLEDRRTVVPPKHLFFPQDEVVFEYAPGEFRETAEASPKLLFGVKPCDLAGLRFAEKFFSGQYPDKYFLSRLEGALIIAKGCSAPPDPATCFCGAAGTGPFAAAGFDLQLVDAGAHFLVETGSAAGERFLAEHASFFGEGDGSGAAALKTKAAAALELRPDFAGALEKIKTADLAAAYARIGERCIYCGACLYTCPTCTCFNVYDRAKDGRGTRSRCWDGCVFAGYTAEASGHNPRAAKARRTARRYEHKLKYDPAAAGRSGCVGCGRCLASCPVAIGMSKFISELDSGKEEM